MVRQGYDRYKQYSRLELVAAAPAEPTSSRRAGRGRPAGAARKAWAAAARTCAITGAPCGAPAPCVADPYDSTHSYGLQALADEVFGRGAHEYRATQKPILASHKYDLMKLLLKARHPEWSLDFADDINSLASTTDAENYRQHVIELLEQQTEVRDARGAALVWQAGPLFAEEFCEVLSPAMWVPVLQELPEIKRHEVLASMIGRQRTGGRDLREVLDALDAQSALALARAVARYAGISAVLDALRSAYVKNKKAWRSTDGRIGARPSAGVAAVVKAIVASKKFEQKNVHEHLSQGPNHGDEFIDALKKVAATAAAPSSGSRRRMASATGNAGL